MAMISTVGSLALDQVRQRERVDALSRQVSTGARGAGHGDLGPAAMRGIDLRGDIAKRGAYIGATDVALARMGTAQGVLARLEGIASNAASEAARARTLGAAGVAALALTARSALEEAAALLNAKHGGEYLFGGSDLANAPVPGAATIGTGAMAAAIATAVGTLDPANAATVLADTATAATAAATAPFSTHLEGAATTEPRRAVQIGDGERLSWGVLASQDSSGAVAQGWGRELLRGLATLAALTPASAQQGAGFDALLVGVAGVLDGATGGLGQERGVLGAAQQRAEVTRERHKDLLVALRSQVLDVEQVDIAEAASALRQAQMRLEASYEATGTVARLSLAALLR